MLRYHFSLMRLIKILNYYTVGEAVRKQTLTLFVGK